MGKEIKVVAYARVSSKEQAEKELSIPAQLEAIRNYCKQKGWKLVHEYIDAGKSAKTDERPEFQRMVAMAKRPNKGFEAIIVHKIDRFSRNRDDHVIYKALLKKLGVTVHSVTEQADTETPHGFLLEGIMEVISEFYNMNLKNETMKGMKENAKRGFHNGGTPPYGYRTSKVKDTNGRAKTIWVLGPDEEINTVRLIFELYTRFNKGYKAIVFELNERQIPSPNGKLWSWTTIWHILHNQTYIGQRVWNKHDYGTGKKKKSEDEWIIRSGTHPSIVDRDTFNLVLKKSAERNPNGSAFKATGPSLFILRGIIKCPMCNANMITGSNNKNSRGKTRYYHCGTYHRKGKNACNRNQVYKEPIEAAVLNTLIREFSILSYPGSIEEEIRKYVDYTNRENIFSIARIDDEIKHIKKRIELAKTEGKSYNSPSYLEEYISQMDADIIKLTNDKESFNKDLLISEVPQGILKLIRDNIRGYISNINTTPPEEQHRLLKSYISFVIADPVSNGFKMKYVIKIPETFIAGTNNIILEKVLYFGIN